MYYIDCRCSRCIAIRTGGGYIILDELASDSAIALRKNRKGIFNCAFFLAIHSINRLAVQWIW